MPNVRQPTRIQEQPDQGGLLGKLFSVMSLIPIPEVQMAGKMGSAFLNPSGSNLGSAGTSIAGMIGGGSGDLTKGGLLTGALSGKPEDPNIEDGEIIQKKDLDKDNEIEAPEVPVGEVNSAPAEDKPGAKPENPLDIYSGMTMDEVFKMHPELQSMFTQQLFQA